MKKFMMIALFAVSAVTFSLTRVQADPGTTCIECEGETGECTRVMIGNQTHVFPGKGKVVECLGQG